MLVLWFFAAHCILWWLLGIALVIAARFLDRYVTRETVRRLDKAGIEEDNDVLLRVNHLKQYFRSGDYINKAVDDVSFYIKKGEVFGLVGESGCGKTTTGRTIINLYDPTEGDVYFEGLRISSTQNGLPVLIRSFKNEFNAELQQKQALLSEQIAADPSAKDCLQAEFKAWKAKRKEELDEKIAVARTRALESSAEKSKCVEKYREKRKAELTAAFNEDMKQLSGKAAEERKARYEIDMKVAAKDNIMTKMQMIFQDPVGSINPRMTVREIIAEGLKVRGIKDEKYIDEKVYEVLDLVGLVREHAARYPHEFSGGQKQRVGIARAIVLEPELIIADEPISALDVSIQAQIINLLNDLRERMGLTILFIAHNLSVVKYFSDRIGVMYYGHLVELTTSDELFAHPLHPYTKSLLSAIPYPDPYHEKYRKRIVYEPHKVHDYSVDKPTLREIRPGHFIRCNDKEFEEYKRELGI
ncbi:MAG: ATP-binding cassette domain-containing protein [Clostridia bacterium]|nr:ATP-binding cassette domain-containing protein [Clostridia bacterium]